MPERPPEVGHLAQILVKGWGIDLEEARRIVDRDVKARMAHIRERRRLERLYDAALEEVAEARADWKQAEQELVRAYAKAEGITLDEARRRVRMEHPDP